MKHRKLYPPPLWLVCYQCLDGKNDDYVHSVEDGAGYEDALSEWLHVQP